MFSLVCESVSCQQFLVIRQLIHSLAMYPDSEQLRSLLSPHVMIDLFFGWLEVENSIVLTNPY